MGSTRMTEDATTQLVADKLAIRELVARYNRAADDLDVDTYVDTYTADAMFEVVGGPSVQGHDAIRELIGTAEFGSVHVTTDTNIKVDGDRATNTCALLLFCRRPDKQAVQFVSTGRYDDELVRTEAGWRFSRRRAATDLAFDALNRRFREVKA